jgi:negative regulator of flagellin synthesis FlgM
VEIRNYLNGLNPASNTTPTSNQHGATAQNTDAPAQSTPNTDRATVSAAGAGISQPASDADVRWEKVTAVQQALAAGTYNIPASAVASKIVDSMIGNH